MKKILILLMAVILWGGLSALPGMSATPDWQQNWDSLVASAKKEGRVMVYLGESPPEVRTEVSNAFNDKYV